MCRCCEKLEHWEREHWCVKHGAAFEGNIKLYLPQSSVYGVAPTNIVPERQQREIDVIKQIWNKFGSVRKITTEASRAAPEVDSESNFSSSLLSYIRPRRFSPPSMIGLFYCPQAFSSPATTNGAFSFAARRFRASKWLMGRSIDRNGNLMRSDSMGSDASFCFICETPTLISALSWSPPRSTQRNACGIVM